MGEVDPSKAVAAGWQEALPVSYNERDIILYSLGIGSSDLRFVYEHDPKFAPFPTYPVVLPFKGTSSDVLPFPPPTLMKQTMGVPGLPMPKGPVLDGERLIEVLNPLPKSGDFQLKTRIVGVHDKGTGAFIETESVLYDANKEYCRIVGGSFYVGATGFKSAGVTYSEKVDPPQRPPDAIVEQTTAAGQTHLYRLSGDYNPLHIDPSMAQAMRFPAPIIHGLCTFGHSARHVLQKYGGNEPSRLKKIRVRFASPLFPGETIATHMWREGNRIVFVTYAKERNKVVMNNCWAELSEVQLASSL